MVQALDRQAESASQTAGPYVHIGCTPEYADLGSVYESADPWIRHGELTHKRRANHDHRMPA